MKKTNILYFNSRKYDFSTSTLIEGLNQLDTILELKTTNLGSYAKPSQVLPENEILDYANTKADIVVLGSNHYVDHKKFWEITSKKVKKVYVDGWDTSQMCLYKKTPYKYFKLDLIFKMSFYLQDNSFKNLYQIVSKRDYTIWSKFRSHFLIPHPYFHSSKNQTRIRDILFNIFYINLQHKVFPLMLGVEKRCQGEFNKYPTCMLSCMISVDRVSERAKVVNLLKSMNLSNSFIGPINEDENAWLKMEKMYGSDPKIPIDLRGYAFHNDAYYHQIEQSLACISLPGGSGFDFRMWEILGRGSLLISKRIMLQMPNPPIENEHYLAFDTIDELKEIIHELYHSHEKIEKIRWAGYMYAKKYHSTYKRAEYFLNIINSSH